MQAVFFLLSFFSIPYRVYFKKTSVDIRRREILDAVEKVHQEHPTHGYRWIAAFLRLNRGIDVHDNYVFKCCKCLGIKSQGQQAGQVQRQPY